MLIAHISDSHIEIPEPDGAGRIADFERVIADINRLDPAPDLVIHTGDVSHCNRKAEYGFARSLLNRLHVDWHVIPGNKDHSGDMAAAFKNDDGWNRVVEHRGWRLMFLDTTTFGHTLGSLSDAAVQWVGDQLTANTAQTVIFMHHPSFHMSDNPYPFQFTDQAGADRFEAMLDGKSHVKHIFCGHAHRNTTGSVAGIDGSTLTAMSLDRRKGTYPPEMDGRPVYQLITLGDDGSVERRLKICD